MTTDHLFSWYWALWLGLGFGVPEAVALISRHPRWTLSAQVWAIEGQGATFVRYFLAAFLVWLLLHMVFRLFT